MAPLTFEDIQKARALLRGVVVETPMFKAPYLSRISGASLYLKMENVQETGSFKARGAYVKMKSLPQEVLKKGVIAMSAGNHGQAVAYHASHLKCPATIVMPVTTPPTKVGKTERWGPNIVLAGETFEDARLFAEDLAHKDNLSLIHPYNDPFVIAGQGTLGIEMLERCPNLEVLLIPIGGGGLCAGVALAAKTLKPSLKVYGVEVEGYASMAHALYGREEKTSEGATLAEGIAVKKPGKLPQEILKNYLEDIFVVTEEEIERAVDLFVRKQNIVVEGAGAVGLAAVMQDPSLFSQKQVGLVISGGNIDARLVSALMMRGQIREGLIGLFQIKIQDTPGVLAQISQTIADYQGNILGLLRADKSRRNCYKVGVTIEEAPMNQLEVTCLDQMVLPSHRYRKFVKLWDFKEVDRLLKHAKSSNPNEGYGLERIFRCLLLQFLEDLSDRELEVF